MIYGKNKQCKPTGAMKMENKLMTRMKSDQHLKEEQPREDQYRGGSSTSQKPQTEKDYTKAIVILIIVIAIASSIFTLS